MTTKETLQIAKLLIQERDIRKKINALQDRLKENDRASKWHSWSWSDTYIVLDMSLPEYLSMFPDSVPKWETYEHEGTVKGWYRYGRAHVGKVCGKDIWVEASTPRVVLSEPKPAETTITPVKEEVLA